MSTKPLAATDRPVKALRSEITTGMSAPPIGMTKATPSTRARASNGTKKIGCDATARLAMASAMIATARRPLTTCWPAYVMGVPVIRPCSLAKAIALPANEMPPTTMEKMLGNARWNAGCDPVCRSSEIATSAAAPPPTPLKAATICGMAVMCTRRAEMAPTGTPIARPRRVTMIPAIVKCRSGIVASNAITIPTAAIWLPRRAPRGLLSCFKPRMKSTAANR